MKKATTVEEQVKLLKQRNVQISDETKAKEVLLDIGYYRLGFYFFPFENLYPALENRDHNMKVGTKFMNAVNLYYFDFDLRNTLLRYTSRIEVAFRTYLTYAISNKYRNSPTWFVDSRVVEANYILEFDTKVYTDDFKKNSVIKRHHEHNINDKYAPAWKTIEMMSFGSVYKLFLALKSKDDQQMIAKKFGIQKVDVFINYMHAIVFVRNKCAHGNAIFDMNLPFGIQSVAIGSIQLGCESTINTAIRVISYILGQISKNRKQEMHTNLKKIADDAILNDADLEEIIRKVIKND